jgi:DNA polymerase III epsilon subunit-like protein
VPRAVRPEVLISVDVEASGPSPGTGSLIAIGACLVHDIDATFYRELLPIPGLPWDRSAERVHGLSRTHLAEHGEEPAVVMAAFVDWVAGVSGEGVPVFVGFNAPFDWMFVADYLHRFTGGNPFGYSALDLKAVYLARHRVARWAETTKRHIQVVHPVALAHTHQALDDARMQALLAVALLGPGDAEA